MVVSNNCSERRWWGWVCAFGGSGMHCTRVISGGSLRIAESLQLFLSDMCRRFNRCISRGVGRHLRGFEFPLFALTPRRFLACRQRGSAACSASVNSHRETFSCLFRAGNTTRRLLQAGRGGREYSIHHVLTAVGDEPTHHSRVGNS